MSFITSHYVLHGPTHNGWLFLVYASQHITVFISHYFLIKFLVQSTNLDFSISNRRIHTSFYMVHTLLPSSSSDRELLSELETQPRRAAPLLRMPNGGGVLSLFFSFRIQHILVM
jgi:hypothetical protein